MKVECIRARVLIFPIMLHHIPETVAFLFIGMWFKKYFYDRGVPISRSDLIIILILVFNSVFTWMVLDIHLAASAIVTSPLLVGYSLYRVAKA